jgi:16S rRNA (cytosine1402-N4)-methyltransferase
MNDVESDIKGKSDAYLLDITERVIKRYESNPDISLRILADSYGVIEINVVDENGMIVKSTNADVVNQYDADTLARVLREYGELDTTWKIASCIVRAREQSPITTTSQLVEAVKPCTPKRDESKFLTKLFQALRIEVNGEMEALKMALEQSLKVLRPGGRLVVISYHSLEDRLVKNFMRSGNFEGKVQQDFFGRSEVPFEVVSRKAIVPTDEEIARNPRSRSAKLRVAVKL